MSTAQSDNLLDHALVYLRLGLVPIPCRTGRPLIPWRTFQERIPSEGEVRGMPWSQADAVAVVLGHEHPSLGGYWWVLDVEAYARQEAETWLDGARPEWRSSLVSRTQRDGRHIFCLARSPVRTARCPWGDLKGVGSLALVPPSRAHKPDATYDTYTWLSFGEPLLLEPGELPRVDEKAGAVTDRVPVRELLQHPIVEGTRNMALTRIAGALRRLGLSAEEVFATLEVINTTHCRPPLPSEEVATIARSSANWPAGAPPRHDDRGAAPGATDKPDERDNGAPRPQPIPPQWLPRRMSELAAGSGEGQGGEAWLWPGLLRYRNLTLLSAYWKAGKTTLIGCLLRAMQDGSELLGRPVRAARAVIISEETADVWVERARRLGLDDRHLFVCRPFSGRPSPSDWLRFLDHLEQVVQQNEVGLVIFDSYTALAPVRDENDAAMTAEAILPLQALAERTQAAILLTAHLRKTDATGALATRGSGALGAIADILVEMRRLSPDLHDTRRTLTVYSRFGCEQFTIDWQGGCYVVGDSAPAVAGRELTVLAALAKAGEQGLTVDELAEATGLSRTTISRVLADLAERGKVNRTGVGGRGTPYRWFVTSTDQPPLTPGTDFVHHHIRVERGEQNRYSESRDDTTPGQGGKGEIMSSSTSLYQGGSGQGGERTPGLGKSQDLTEVHPGLVGEVLTGCTDFVHHVHTLYGGEQNRYTESRDSENGGHGRCVVCGRPTAQWGDRPARYCSEACRKRAKREHAGGSAVVLPAAPTSGQPAAPAGVSVPHGPGDVVSWGECLLAELRAGRVQLPEIELKPGHRVVVPERFLASHLAESKFGIRAAIENLRAYRAALARLAQYRQAIDPPSELDDAWVEQPLAVRHL